MFTEPPASPRSLAPKRRLQLLRIAEALSKLHRHRVRLVFYQRWRLYVVAKALSGIQFQMLSCRQPEAMRTNGGGPTVATLLLKTGKKTTTKKRVSSTTRIFSSAMGTPPQSPSSVSASLGILSGTNPSGGGGPLSWPTTTDAVPLRIKDREGGGGAAMGSSSSAVRGPTGSPQYEALQPSRSTAIEDWREAVGGCGVSSSSSATSALFKEVMSLRSVVESQKRSIDMRDRLINELSRERDSLVATVDRVTQQSSTAQEQQRPRGEYDVTAPIVAVLASRASTRSQPTSIPTTPESPSAVPVCCSVQPSEPTPQNPGVQVPSSRTPLPLWLESSSDPAVTQFPAPLSGAVCVTPAPPQPVTSQSPAFTIVPQTTRLRNIAAACDDQVPPIVTRRRASVDVAPPETGDAARSKDGGVACSVDQVVGDAQPLPTSRTAATGFIASPPAPPPPSNSTPRLGGHPTLLSPPIGATLQTSASVLNARSTASLTISAFVHGIKSSAMSCTSSGSNASTTATSTLTSPSTLSGESVSQAAGRAASGLVQVISSANRKQIAAVRGTSLLPTAATLPQKASATTPK